MKILTADKIREADAYTIKHEPVKSIDLMERAGVKCYEWLYQKAPMLFPPAIAEEKDWVFYIVCGVGNNGGDGLVIARHLQRNGYNAQVVIVDFSKNKSADFEKNLERLGKSKKGVVTVAKEDQVVDFPNDAVIVDCIFGTGLNRITEGVARKVIEKINESQAKVVSIDLPSGLFDGDNATNNFSGVVVADYVLTFQVPKLCFFLSECARFSGNVEIIDIGLHPDFLREVETPYRYFTLPLAAQMRKPREKFSHKGSYGHALLIGGAHGKWGALILSAMACMRSGAGLCTVHVGKGGIELMHQAIPEVMASADTSENRFSEIPDLTIYNAVGIGPGMGQAQDTVRAFKLLIQEAKVPLVIDADALNILAENPTWLAFLPKGSILTPHPGEFFRLVGEKLSHFQAIQKQRELSQKHGVYIVLKGANSSLSLPDGKVLINSTGNPGMATGGMGDVLTGIITGLLAAGYSSFHAAAMGMFIHGVAGDLALNSQSVESLIATDLIDNLGKAFEFLTHDK